MINVVDLQVVTGYIKAHYPTIPLERSLGQWLIDLCHSCSHMYIDFQQTQVMVFLQSSRPQMIVGEIFSMVK